MKEICCCHCGRPLPEKWIKSRGAALMGSTKGKIKARSRELARKAAVARWYKSHHKLPTPNGDTEYIARVRSIKLHVAEKHDYSLS